MEKTMFCSICKAVAYVNNGKIDRTCGHYDANLLTTEEKNESIRLFQRGQSDALEGMFSRARAGIDGEYAADVRNAEREVSKKVKQMSDEDLLFAWKALQSDCDLAKHYCPFVSMDAWAKIVYAEKSSRRL